MINSLLSGLLVAGILAALGLRRDREYRQKKKCSSRQMANTRCRRQFQFMPDHDVVQDSVRLINSRPTQRLCEATGLPEGLRVTTQVRILVGADAERLDELVRQSPERAYDIDFFEGFACEAGWRIGTRRLDRRRKSPIRIVADVCDNRRSGA